MADSHSSHVGDDAHEHGVGHIVPVKGLVAVGTALLFLTWVTVFVAKFDFGEANIYIALAVAAVKASLVCLFFMHLFWDRAANSIIMAISLAAVVLFIAFSMTDVAENMVDVKAYEETELMGGDASKVQTQLTATEAEIQKMKSEAGSHSDGDDHE